MVTPESSLNRGAINRLRIFVNEVRAFFLDHNLRHENGGEDEINLALLDGEPNTVTDAKILIWMDL